MDIVPLILTMIGYLVGGYISFLIYKKKHENQWWFAESSKNILKMLFYSALIAFILGVLIMSLSGCSSCVDCAPPGVI